MPNASSRTMRAAVQRLPAHRAIAPTQKALHDSALGTMSGNSRGARCWAADHQLAHCLRRPVLVEDWTYQSLARCARGLRMHQYKGFIHRTFAGVANGANGVRERAIVRSAHAESL
jgi:hypothetical protein